MLLMEKSSDLFYDSLEGESGHLDKLVHKVEHLEGEEVERSPVEVKRTELSELNVLFGAGDLLVVLYNCDPVV